MTDQPGQTGQNYRQVSSHLTAAREDVTRLLDLLCEGLTLEAHVRRDDAHRASAPDSTPDSALSNGAGETSGPEAGEPR